jgi:hypothetical protein
MTQLTEDTDLKRFVELFDTAMTSKNPAVQKCFHNLLMVASLVHAEDNNNHKSGPLKKLFEEMEATRNEVAKLRMSIKLPSVSVYPYPIMEYPTVPTGYNASSTYGSTTNNIPVGNITLH